MLKGLLHFSDFQDSDFSLLHGKRSVLGSETPRGLADVGKNVFLRGVQPVEEASSSLTPAPGRIVLKVLSPLPMALELRLPPEDCVLWRPALCHRVPANENVAFLVEGQLNPPNFCSTCVVSQWTSMLRKSAKPW